MATRHLRLFRLLRPHPRHERASGAELVGRGPARRLRHHLRAHRLLLPGRDDPVPGAVLRGLHAGRRGVRHRRGGPGRVQQPALGPAGPRRHPEHPGRHHRLHHAGADGAVLRHPDGGLVADHRRPDDRRRLQAQPGLRPRLADLQRHRLGAVRHRAPDRPARRRRGADLVARRLCARLRHLPPRARLQAQGPQGRQPAAPRAPRA